LARVLIGRYRLEGDLGRGGMGVVYRARDTLLDRTVAVKVLTGSDLGTAGRARLLREAQAAAQLNHPNIVSIYDAGEAGGVPFIVMELVEGSSLYGRGPVALDELLSIGRQVCAALEHAHAHGIIHRDLKPENILMEAGGAIKLMDFGLARPTAARITSEGTIAGTVFYVAPEQALGRPANAQADLYSLGVVLYELATGRVPFAAGDPLAIIAQHIHEAPTPPRSLQPDLPPGVEALILKLLAKEPADRYASAQETAQALKELARARKTEAAGAARNNLPLQLTSFIGREREVGDVRRLLGAAENGADGNSLGETLGPATASRLLTLTGSAGTGKTRLALEAAGGLLDDYPDGVWLVELASLADPALLPQAVAAVLGVREEPGRPAENALHDYLRDKRLLLLLDNCEHLVNECARVAETLLRACPNLHILATSRESLGIAGETAYRVPSLAFPTQRQAASLPELAQYDAVRLFVDRASAVQPSFRLTEENAPALVRLVARLDGIPLAIELAAARLKALSVEQVADRLNDRFRLLTGGSRTALPRQQTLQALIDWSYDLLSEPERALLRRLSVFAGGFTLEAAESVASDEDQEAGNGNRATRKSSLAKADVLDVLLRLVDKSLVTLERDEIEGDTRYRLLETIRQYALERLLEGGGVEAARARGRHLVFCLALAEQAETWLRGPEQMAWLDQLDLEHDNLRAALDWSLGASEVGGDGAQADRSAVAGLRLAGSLWLFWYLRSSRTEGRAWLERTLEAARPVPNPTDPAELAARDPELAAARSKALAGVGWLADESPAATVPYAESLALARALGDRWGMALALRGLAEVKTMGGDKNLARAEVSESLAIFRELGDTWGEALALFGLAWLPETPDGDRMAGRPLWEASLKLFRQSGDRWGMAVALAALSQDARVRGDYEHAAALSQDSLVLFRELGDKAGMATSLNHMALVAYRRAEYDRGRELLGRTLTLNEESGNVHGVAWALAILGLVSCYQGRYAESSELTERALKLLREVRDEDEILLPLSIQGLVAHYQSDHARADELWEESLVRARENDDKWNMGLPLNGLAMIALLRGEYEQADAYLQESLAVSRAVVEKRNEALALHYMGRLERVQGHWAQARAHYCESLAIRRTLGARRGMSETLGEMAQLAVAEGGRENTRRGARLFGASEALRERIGVPLPPVDRALHERWLAAGKAALGEAEFEALCQDGRAMELGAAVAYALGETDDRRLLIADD
jgi:predicted ATPase